MAHPNYFITSGDVSANYDYFDLFRLTGYKKFYLCAADDSVGYSYFLTTEQLNANPTVIQYGSNNTAIQLRNDTDFDLEMNKATTLRGDVFINSTFYATASDSGAGKYGYGYIIVNIYHVNSVGTETLLGTSTTDTHNGSGVGTTTYWRDCLKISISETNFAVGEKLRINVLHYHGSAGIANSSSGYYIDPSSFQLLGASNYPSDFAIVLPFKITD